MIPAPLNLQPIATGKRPVISMDIRRRVVASCEHQQWFQDNYGEWFEWDRAWRSLPVRAFDILTDEERVQIWLSDVIASDLGYHLSHAMPTRIIEKVRLSLWYYGAEDDWNTLVRFYREVCTFDLGIPDFAVDIDWPRGWQGYGTGESCGEWLDGALAYILSYRGKPVARIGFSVCSRGVLIQQVQANSTRGNRWMYRMGAHPMDAIVAAFARHFDAPLWIVDGASQGAYIHSLHGTNSPVSITDLRRIVDLYDREIVGFCRSDEVYYPGRHLTGDRRYLRLEANEYSGAESVSGACATPNSPSSTSPARQTCPAA